MAGTQPTLITSVRRALAVIEIVAESPRPITAKTISRRTGLSLGTTYNLIRTLQHDGYLVAERDGLVLGDRLPGMAGSPGGMLIARGRSVLKELCRDLKAATYLTVFADGEIRLVDIVDSAEAPRVELCVGVQDSAHATAFGKQILAALPAKERLDYLHRHPPAPLTPYTIADPRDLLRTLDRTTGAAVDRQEYALGHRCIAVPVQTPTMVGAVAISMPADRPDPEERMIAALRDGAERLAVRLGTGTVDQFII